MRKLISFYKICFCYLVLIVFLLISLPIHFLFAFLFVFINPEKFHDVISKCEKKLCKIAEDKIKKIEENEFDILNADTPLCERCKKLSWNREILITIMIIAIITITIYMKNC